MYKKFTIKFVNGEEYNYANIIAKTFAAAMKYAEENGYGTLDQVEYVSTEKVDIAE